MQPFRPNIHLEKHFSNHTCSHKVQLRETPKRPFRRSNHTCSHKVQRELAAWAVLRELESHVFAQSATDLTNNQCIFAVSNHTCSRKVQLQQLPAQNLYILESHVFAQSATRSFCGKRINLCSNHTCSRKVQRKFSRCARSCRSRITRVRAKCNFRLLRSAATLNSNHTCSRKVQLLHLYTCVTIEDCAPIALGASKHPERAPYRTRLTISRVFGRQYGIK